MDVEECERIVSSYQLPPNVTVKCTKWDGEATTKTARGYFTADALDESSGKPGHELGQSSPVIVLLPERIHGGEREIRELLSHELVHAYDHCVLRRDLTQCEELACSEIRAAREAECAGFETHLIKGMFCRNMAPGTQYCLDIKRSCVERIAVRSTKSVFGQEQAAMCVKAVFDRCMGDVKVPRVVPKQATLS
jgi:hypothetical protein